MFKILAVEDNPAILDFYVEFFTEFEYQVITAEDALAAIARYKESSPDIVILDLDIPGGGGMLVYETIRTNLKMDTPVIFSTGKPEELAALKDLKNAEALGKPTPPEVLMNTVQKLQTELLKKKKNRVPPPPPPHR